MTWTNFTEESKKYMNHPKYWNENDAYPYSPNGWKLRDKRKASILFWIKYPRAFVRFWYYSRIEGGK